MYSVLMIDDDLSLGKLLLDSLRNETVQLVQAGDVSTGLTRLAETPYHLVILDVMLPDMDGFSALKRIRQQGYDLPILMLSARGDTIDRIVGIELGADDYLPKPFDLQELIARLKALLRRAQIPEKSPTMPEHNTYQDQHLTLDRDQRRVYWNNLPVTLSSTEFSLLSLLVAEKGLVVTKAYISEQILGRPLARYERSIDVHISNLRAKLGVLSDDRSCIQTVFRQGYQYIWEV